MRWTSGLHEIRSSRVCKVTYFDNKREENRKSNRNRFACSIFNSLVIEMSSARSTVFSSERLFFIRCLCARAHAPTSVFIFYSLRKRKLLGGSGSIYIQRAARDPPWFSSRCDNAHAHAMNPPKIFLARNIRYKSDGQARM